MTFQTSLKLILLTSLKYAVLETHVREVLHWTCCGMQQKRQIKITISEFNFIIINIKVNDNYFNVGIIKLAVLLNFRDI
jgi:hypothetical protein